MSIKKFYIPEIEKSFLKKTVELLRINATPQMHLNVDVARALASSMRTFSPHLAMVIDSLSERSELTAIAIYGLPILNKNLEIDLSISKTIALAISFLKGEPFQYQQQNYGELVADIKPQFDLQHTQSSGGKVEFGWHTDDAFFSPEVRTNWILLYGYNNPERTLTRLSLIDHIVEKLSQDTLGVLLQKRFSIRVPISIGGTNESWTKPVAVLRINEFQSYEISIPTFDTRASNQSDQAAEIALMQLVDAANSVREEICIDEGVSLIFNNDRCLHARGEIMGDRHIFRIYIRPDLHSLRQQTQTKGNVFDATKLSSFADFSYQKQA